MSKQDRQGVRTPADVERKYNLGKLAASQGLTAKQETRLNQLTQTMNQYMADTNAKIEGLENSQALPEIDNTLKIDEQGVLGVNTTNSIATGNQQPVTSGAVADAISDVLTEDDLTGAINTALAQAKESGEFKGDKGDPGVTSEIEDAAYPGCYYRDQNGIEEWINPPMIAGEEYRTAERYNGEVVYAKYVDFGALPATSSKSVNIGVTPLKIVSIRFVASNASYTNVLPYINASGEVVARFHVNSSGNCVVNTFSDASSYNGNVEIKYVK